jgi:hypothetical protein
MNINQNLVLAARTAVQSGVVAETLAQVPGYPGMFVGIDSCQDLQPMHFFEENDARYAVGPRKK